MNNFIINQGTQIGKFLIDLQYTIPLKPLDMYSFLIKYLDKTNVDFKHIFDYIDSIKQYNEYYLLSMIVLPGCEDSSNLLGNFFGQKMSNIIKSFRYYPFGNVRIGELSLVSKRSNPHPTYLLLSLRGTKDLHSSHPSSSKSTASTIGGYLIENWVLEVLKKYCSYVNSNKIFEGINYNLLPNLNICNNNYNDLEAEKHKLVQENQELTIKLKKLEKKIELINNINNNDINNNNTSDSTSK